MAMDLLYSLACYALNMAEGKYTSTRKRVFKLLQLVTPKRRFNKIILKY